MNKGNTVTMGLSENEKECEVKQRIIPKLTADKAEGRREKKECVKCQGAEAESRKETPEERIERINKVQITFSDFFVKCLDHDMIKLFLLSLFAFLLLVGFVTCIYLFFIFMFKERMWHFYFPTEEMRKNPHGEF